MIPEGPFALYCLAEIQYIGRATSTLEAGRYLLIKKNDGSISIHAGTLIPPRNYLGAASKLTIDGDTLTFVCKKEIIRIKIYQIISLIELHGWSEHKVIIEKTERDLTLKLLINWSDYFPEKFQEVHKEYVVDGGAVDLLGVDIDNRHHLVEVKRKTITLKDCTQLLRYLEHFRDRNIAASGYVAAPNISQKARQYLDKHQLKFIRLSF